MSRRYLIPPLLLFGLIPLSAALVGDKPNPAALPVGTAEASEIKGETRALPRQPSVDADIIQQISNRPLFSADRRSVPVEVEETKPEPVPKPEPTVKKAPPAIPKLRLMGLVQREDGARKALLLLESGKELWAAQSDKLGDWNVVSVSAKGVVIERDGVQAKITFESE